MVVSEAKVNLTLGYEVVALMVIPFSTTSKFDVILGWDCMRSAGVRLDVTARGKNGLPTVRYDKQRSWTAIGIANIDRIALFIGPTTVIAQLGPVGYAPTIEMACEIFNSERFKEWQQWGYEGTVSSLSRKPRISSSILPPAYPTPTAIMKRPRLRATTPPAQSTELVECVLKRQPEQSAQPIEHDSIDIQDELGRREYAAQMLAFSMFAVENGQD
ncbi:TPA: hypothetical protein N0F65_008908 [Lagenidium giganteum]|uniref:Uncharacterized protein n=1 Tax=Lagenidium giganteum TaxID=4803 RepID=A0AAV2YYS7_9STRA|nr:TPA: hypothetical protein N0F65_008908 [Lagenidium giganteum]